MASVMQLTAESAWRCDSGSVYGNRRIHVFVPVGVFEYIAFDRCDRGGCLGPTTGCHPHPYPTESDCP